MAKKKVANQTKQEPNPQNNHEQDQTTTLSRQPSVEDPTEKLHNLKSLNSMLLKETVEKRQKIESLAQAKDALEAELATSRLGKSSLESDLDQVTDENVSLELEKCLFWVFMENRFREMGAGIDGLEREKSETEREVVLLKSKVDALTGRIEMEKEETYRVCVERDSVKSDFGLQVKETNLLKKRVIGMEENERNLEETMKKLKEEKEGLMNENKNSSAVIKRAMQVKEELEKDSMEKSKEIECLKMEITSILMEKKEVSIQNNLLKTKIDELEKKLGLLNEIVLNLRKEETLLRRKVLELEMSSAEAVEREKEMTLKINALVEENGDKEKTMEKLMVEKEDIATELESTTMESEKKERLMEELSRKMNAIEELKLYQESKLVDVQREASELKDLLVKLQESLDEQKAENEKLFTEAKRSKDRIEQITLERYNAALDAQQERENIEYIKFEKERIAKELKLRREEYEFRLHHQENELQKENLVVQKEADELRDALKNMQSSFNEQKEINQKLHSEVSEARNGLDRVSIERGQVLKNLENERKNGSILASKVSTLEKKIDEMKGDFTKVNGECKNMIKERKEMESRFDLLKKQKDDVHKVLLQAEKRISDLEKNIDSAGVSSKRALSMLKNTAAAILCQSTSNSEGKDGVTVIEKKLGNNGVEPYAVELEAIRKAFKDQGEVVEDMKRQVELMQSSVMEANKKKSFWTIVSSATTLFAAASVAYVARTQ